ncbi:hypothetical protein [Clostridium sp. DJ247]|uniref:hypothetical protein n=1 Tax=Clostridium sp. DJ247 TaxID=2726188 RepID=UPI001624F2DF|nr:hypothetical protein [Clostridium sp. DJ247]MBC2581032.1 hypothetical protein [Clostridium sp. DJ247]
MINTMVCKKEGCSGNTFKVSVQRLKLILICAECKDFEKYNKEMNLNIPTICSKCTGEVFKIGKNIETKEMVFQCMCCGHKFTFMPNNKYIAK